MINHIRIISCSSAILVCSLVGTTVAQEALFSAPQRGTAKIQARYFNPFIVSQTSRVTVNPFGLPETGTLSTPFGNPLLSSGPDLNSRTSSPVASTSAAASLSVSPTELPVAASSGRPVYRPPVRSPYRPPPRPSF